VPVKHGSMLSSAAAVMSCRCGRKRERLMLSAASRSPRARDVVELRRTVPQESKRPGGLVGRVRSVRCTATTEPTARPRTPAGAPERGDGCVDLSYAPEA